MTRTNAIAMYEKHGFGIYAQKIGKKFRYILIADNIQDENWYEFMPIEIKGTTYPGFISKWLP